MAKYLVTGAGGGMGSAICRRLAEEGHQVWGIDRNIPDGFTGAGFIAADLTRREDVQAAFDQIHAEAGCLNGIIHAAGVYDLNSLVEIQEEEFRRDFDINLFGIYRVNRLFMPVLSPRSRIIIISSELAPLHPLPFTGIYAITKTAVEQYAAALRMELQLLGHQVVVVRPGAVKTGMLPASTKKLENFCAETRYYRCNAERFHSIVRRVETRNISPEKIAETVSRSLAAARPRLVCNVNRNPLLLLFNALPKRAQLRIIRRILADQNRQ